MHAAQLSQTLLAAWRQRDRSSPWGRRLIAALLVLSTLASLALLDGPPRWLVPMGIVLVVIHSAWLVVGMNLQEQNHPTAARCVPGHLRMLRRAALVGWALCAGLGTLLLWAMLPPALLWQSLLLGNAAMAAFLLWSVRAWWMWLAVVIYFPLFGLVKPNLAPLMQAAHAQWQARPNELLALGLLALAGLVVVAFGRGDARHRRVYERQRVMRQVQRMQMEGRPVSPAQSMPWLEVLSRPFEGAMRAWQRHLVARADNGHRGNVLARMELVLHGSQHWVYQLMGALTILPLVMLSLVVVVERTGVSLALLLEHGAFGMSIGLVSMALNPTMGRPALWQSRREQALLRLLPGVPQGAALNRGVAWISLRQGLVACMLIGLALPPLALAAQQPFLLWLPVVGVPWTIWNTTRSPARMRPPNMLTSLLPMVAFYASAGLAHLACTWLGLPMPALAGLMLAASAAWGAWRWRRLDGQPAALPAGRLA